MDLNEEKDFPEAQPEPATQEPAVPQQEYTEVPTPAASTEQPAPIQEPAPETAPEVNPQPTAEPAHRRQRTSPYANSPYVMNHPVAPQTPRALKVKKPRTKGKNGRRILAVLLALVCAGGIFGGFFTLVKTQNANRTMLESRIAYLENRLAVLESAASAPAVSPNIQAAPPQNGVMTPSQVYAACVESVVTISSTIQTFDFYSGPVEGDTTGSGFVVSADGYVITNYHVVEDATAVEVILHGGESYPAKVVGNDSASDLAVLKIEATDLKPAALGSSAELSIGDMVTAIGNPLGELATTQTVGYVSGINREVTTDNTIISMIQTDAAINPGNSGGPLFNMYGQVVGITTAKYSGTTGSGASIEGLGFAIPIDDVIGSVSDLIDFGYVTGAYLGVTVQNMDPDSASMYNLPVGAYVVSVVDGLCAQEAGVQPKDIIIDLGGHKVSSITDLTRALRNFKGNDTTTITVVRGGTELVLDITLDEKPQTPAADPNMPSSGDYQEWFDYFSRRIG